MLGWDASGLPQVEFSAENFDDRTEVRYAGSQRRHPKGLRLTKFDKPVIHNRKLLDALYFGSSPPRLSAVADRG